jgi:hypothetical protein
MNCSKIVIPADLMILGTEFLWARRSLVTVKSKFQNHFKAGDRMKTRGKR